LNCAAPVALSFYAARAVPSIAGVVPTDLTDHSVSQAPGVRLSYIGYDFEIPWNDLDESKTEQYPKDKPNKTRVVLTFRSGLRLMVTAVPPREFAGEFATDFKMSPQQFEVVFGQGAATSDYTFVRNVYEFCPKKMHYWALSSGVHYREQIEMMIKSIMPTKSAETGIFYVQNQQYKGFQQGNPQVHQGTLLVSLYANDGSVEIMIAPKNYSNPAGITQPEINRIIQSLHKAAPSDSLTATN
jgi:hypothetical protein